MLNRINLVIKSPFDHILIVKEKFNINNKWDLPYLFLNYKSSKFINSIIDFGYKCGIEEIKTITVLYEESQHTQNKLFNNLTSYYELITSTNKILLKNDRYLFTRFFTINHLKILNGKSNDINYFLNIINN